MQIFHSLSLGYRCSCIFERFIDVKMNRIHTVCEDVYIKYSKYNMGYNIWQIKYTGTIPFLVLIKMSIYMNIHSLDAISSFVFIGCKFA